MENIYIVYADDDVYLVKTTSEKEAVNIVYNEEIEPMSNMRRGYISTRKSDLRAILVDEEMGNKKIICLT